MNDLEQDIIRNLYKFYHRIALLNGYMSGTVEGVKYVWNKEGSWPAYLMGTPRHERIPLIVEAIGQGKAPPFWILEKGEAKTRSLLEGAGVRAIREWKGMAVTKKDLRKTRINDSIQIRSNESNIIHDWITIANNELMTGKQISEEFLHRLSETREFKWVVAYLDGEAVGTGLSFTSEGVAGIYMISTSGSFRGRGIGSKITRVLTEEALDSGNHAVVLHATGQGVGIYRRTGFVEVNALHVLWYLGRT